MLPAQLLKERRMKRNIIDQGVSGTLQSTSSLKPVASQINNSSRSSAPQSNTCSRASTSTSTSTSTSSKRTRGPTYCNEIWYRDDDQKLQLEFNSLGQPVGKVGAKFSSSCGKVARICSLCPIIHNDWRDVKADTEGEIISYMKERFVITPDAEKILLHTIGDLWKNYKGKLRKDIYRLVFEDKVSRSSVIASHRPKKVDSLQWRQFVNFWLSADGLSLSKKGKTSKEQQTINHTCGSKSYARKRKEMEDERGGRPVGDLEFFRETHKGKGERIEDNVLDVLDKCEQKMQEKMTSFQANGDAESSFSSEVRLRLEEEVLREVRGPEHPGRLRGAGRGPTITTRMKGHATYRLEAEVEYLKKRDAERDNEMAYLKRRDAERETEFQKMKEMFETYMNR